MTTKMKGFLHFEDMFEVKCKSCGSIKVSFHSNECGECGTNLEGFCYDCKKQYKYHDFIPVEREFDEKGDLTDVRILEK